MLPPGNTYQGVSPYKRAPRPRAEAAATALAGERNTIQTVVELGKPRTDTARTRLVDDSRHQSARHIISRLAAARRQEILVADIYRCQESCALPAMSPTGRDQGV